MSLTSPFQGRWRVGRKESRQCKNRRGSSGSINTGVGVSKGSGEASVRTNVGDEKRIGACKNKLLYLREEAKRRSGGFDKRNYFQERNGMRDVCAVCVEIERGGDKRKSL